MVAFGELFVKLLELEMFQSSNEMDGKYFPSVSRAKFQKNIKNSTRHS